MNPRLFFQRDGQTRDLETHKLDDNNKSMKTLYKTSKINIELYLKMLIYLYPKISKTLRSSMLIALFGMFDWRMLGPQKRRMLNQGCLL